MNYAPATAPYVLTYADGRFVDEIALEIDVNPFATEHLPSTGDVFRARRFSSAEAASDFRSDFAGVSIHKITVVTVAPVAETTEPRTVHVPVFTDPQ